MLSKTTVFVLVVFVGVAWGYSGGAPETVCEDMTPKHPAAPKDTDIPYVVKPDKSSVKAGGRVKVSIQGKKPFKGYLLQIRDGDKAAGHFVISDSDRYSKTINCHGSKQNAATHKNSADKKELTLEWEAPIEKKTYTIYATVAENGAVYWVHKKMGVIKVE